MLGELELDLAHGPELVPQSGVFFFLLMVTKLMKHYTIKQTLCIPVIV